MIEEKKNALIELLGFSIEDPVEDNEMRTKAIEELTKEQESLRLIDTYLSPLTNYEKENYE